MRDVEEQLRAYGDAVEDVLTRNAPSTDLVTVGRRHRRPVLLGALAVAAAVLLVVVGVVVIRSSDDGGHVQSVTTRPRARHVVAPVTASVRLDANVVPAGEDILGTVTLHNHGDAPALLRNGCRLGVHVEFGGIHPYKGYGGCGRFVASPDAYVRPGRSEVRFALSTVGQAPRKSQLWVAGTRTTTGVTIVARSTRPRACTAADIALTDAGPLSTRGAVSVRHIVAVNQGPTDCRLDGAPVMEIDGLPNLSSARPPARGRVHRLIVLAPGDRASVLVEVSQPPTLVCTAVPHILQTALPDGGGTLGLQLSDPNLWCIQARAVTNFVAGDRVSTSLLRGLEIEPALSATLTLDKRVIRRGEDVIGTLTLVNRTTQPVVVGTDPQCRQAWSVLAGEPFLTQPLVCLPGEPTVADRSLIPPGRTRVRFVSPTTQARTSTVVVHMPPTVPSAVTPVVRFRWARARANPSFCTADRLQVEDRGGIPLTRSVPPGYSVHRFVVMNRSSRPCRLDGAPVVTVQNPAAPAGSSLLPAPTARHDALILRPGGTASALVSVVLVPSRLACVTPVDLDLVLPDGGGTATFVTGSTNRCSTLATLTNFVAGGRADEHLLQGSRDTRSTR